MTPAGRACGLVIFVAIVSVAGACNRDRETTVTQPPTAGTDSVRTIALPDISRVAESVRVQITERFGAVTATSNEPPEQRAAAYGELGVVLLSAGFTNAAEMAFQNAEWLSPADARWPYYLGHVYRERNEQRQAISAFTRARHLAPADLPTLVWLGELHLATGKPEDAIEPLTAALEAAPGNPRVLGALARASLDRGDYAGAVARFEEALRLSPGASALRYPASRAYRALGDSTNADAQLRLRGDAEPRLADPLMDAIRSSLDSAAAYDRRSREALSRGDWAQALAEARAGLKLVDENTVLRATLHHRIGTALAQTGDPRAAMEEFRRAVAVAPEFAPAHYSSGLLLMQAGQNNAAIRALSLALQHEPTSTPALIARGDAHRRIGRASDALADYRRALEFDRNAVPAQFGEAVALIGLKRHAEAHQLLVQATAAHPGDRPLTFALARLLAASSDVSVRDAQRALAVAEPLVQRAPTLEGAETVAFILAAQGRFAEAIALQRQAALQAERNHLTPLARAMDATRRVYERRTLPPTLWREEPRYDPAL